MDREVEFLAVDEIQLVADPERGHVFTQRLLHARGRFETMFLGAGTMAPLVAACCRRRDRQPGAAVDADLRRLEEADPPAAPQRHRRLLRRPGSTPSPS